MEDPKMHFVGKIIVNENEEIYIFRSNIDYDFLKNFIDYLQVRTQRNYYMAYDDKYNLVYVYPETIKIIY